MVLLRLHLDLAAGEVDLTSACGSTDFTAWVTAPAQWPQVMPCTWKVWFMGNPFAEWGGARSVNLATMVRSNAWGSPLAWRRLIHVKA